MPPESEVNLEIRRAALESFLHEHGVPQETPDGWRYFLVDEPLSVLEQSVRDGYILHGTSRRIDHELIPQHAYDLAKASGNRKAVYLTKNPLVAEFAGITGGRAVNGRENQTHLEIDDETGEFRYSGEQRFRVGALDRVAPEGFVYIFDQTQADEELNGELLAYERIRPLAVVKFDRAKFQHQIDEITPDLHQYPDPSIH